MSEETKIGNAKFDCAAFDALLSDALDGRLAAPRMAEFQQHAAACADCGPLFSFAAQGMRLLRSLEEVEPPRNLVHNVLVATTGVAESKVDHRLPGWMDRIRAAMRPMYAPVLQPRFVASFGMAFFSVMVMLNVAGVNLADARHLDLRPAAVQQSLSQQYHQTRAGIVKYYENLRFVYEIESRVQALREAAFEEQPEPETTPQPEKPQSEDKSRPRRDEAQREQNYRREVRQAIMALAQPAPPESIAGAELRSNS